MSKFTHILRTCKPDMSAYDSFTWPTSGSVECLDWNPIPKCGQGLHGLAKGEGSANLLSSDSDAKWLVVKVLTKNLIHLTDNGLTKCKFPSGEVIYCGDRDGAVALIQEKHPEAACVFGRVAVGDGKMATAGDHGTATAGDRGTATAGYRGTATAGDRGTATAGYRGTATAGDRGTATAGNYGTAIAGDHGTATAGYRGTATAGGCGTATAGYRGTATAGNGGTATAGDGGTATAGKYGTATAGNGGTATAGNGGTATAGNDGEIHIRYWDGSRYRTAIGYIGENGLKPNTPYKLNENHEFVEIK